MKITANNISEEYPKLSIKLPKELNKDEFKFIEESLDLYKKDETIKKYIDVFLLTLNKYIANHDSPKPLKLSDIPTAVKKIMPPFQQKAIVGSIEHWDVIERIEKDIKNIPTLYGAEKAFSKFQDETQSTLDYKNFTLVHMHFFKGETDFFVLEWDKSDTLFGYMVLNGDVEMSELGYSSLKEFHDTKTELDFYWKPKTLQEALYKLDSDYFAKPEKRESTKPKKSKVKTTKPSKRENPSSNKDSLKSRSNRKKELSEKVEKVQKIEHFSLDEKYIKRYLLLHNKVKTKGQILTFIKSLQKSIIDKQIGKTSKYAKQIEAIQTNLIKLYNTDTEDSFTVLLDDKIIAELKKIVRTKKVRLSVTYIKRFISLYAKQTKENVQRLLSLIEKAISSQKILKSDPYFDRIIQVKKALQKYINKEDLSISESELRGLSEIAGSSVPKQVTSKSFKDDDIVCSMDLKGHRFSYIGFTGIWKKMIGDPENPFHVMIYGAGGKGKSTFSVKFAKYLSNDLHLNTLYIADEEKVSGKLAAKLKHFDAHNPKLNITGKLPQSLNKFDVVFLDSVTSMGIRAEELEQLQKKFPNVSFIYILQTNKQGLYFGAKKWEHLGDVVMKFEDGMVQVEKTRFGETGEHKMKLYN